MNPIGFANPSPIQQHGLQKVVAKKAESTESTGLKEVKTNPSFTQKVVQFFSNILSFLRNLGSTPAEKPVTMTEAPRPPIATVTVSVAKSESVSESGQAKARVMDLAATITGPILSIVTTPNPEDKSMAELRQLTQSLKDASQACSPKNLDAMAKSHALSPEDMALLKTEVLRVRDQVQSFKATLAEVAPQAMLRELASQDLGALQSCRPSQVQADLKALGCTGSDQQRVETALNGLKHMAAGLGAAASGLSLPGLPYTGSPDTVSARMYADIPQNTRLAFANLYGDGVLSATKETAQLFKQAGVHMQFFPAAALATNMAAGDYNTLMALQRPPIAGDKLGVRFHSFETLPLTMAMNTASTPEQKSRVLIQHGLQTTLNKLSHAVVLRGKDGHDVKLNTQAFKFDARTVTSLLACAKPEDKQQFDLLFANAMILQHKLDTNSPMQGPVSPEFAAELDAVLGMSDSQEVAQLVSQGFQSQGDVTQALSFMTRFAERLGDREDIQKTMMDLVASPMDAIEKFEAAILQSALSIGGTDSKQAASMLQGVLEKGGTVGGVDVLQASKRSTFEKITDLQHTVSTKIFDARKGIHNNEDRLKRLDYDNQALDKILSHIDDCDTQIAAIDAELGALETAGALPTGIEIQHVRHVVNADLARQEVHTITTGGPFARPDADSPIVDSSVLQEKLSFATLPSTNLFGRQSVYNFKQEDMTSMIKAESKDGKTLLALYDRQPGRPESEDVLIGYLDPARDKAFISSYVKNAGASIAYADKASHSASVRSGMSATDKEAAIRKDVLTDIKKSVTGERNVSMLEKTKREAKITTLTATESTAFKSTQKAVRVAIAEYVREQLGTVSRPEMASKMDDIVADLHSSPEAISAIATKLVGVDANAATSLIQSEARAFTGPETFGQWQGDYRVKDAMAQKDMARADAVRDSVAYQRMNNDAAASDLINGLKSEGDHVTLSFGKRIEVNTAIFSRSVTAAFTSGVVQASLSGKSENSDDIKLVKTDKGYQIQLEQRQLKAFGMNSIFADIATVGVTAGASSNVGYHLDFNSAEKAAQFLSAIASGNTAAVADKSCLGLPSAVSLSSGKALFGGVSVGLQLVPSIPGLDAELNFGNVGLSLSGERRSNVVGDTSSTTTTFSGKFSYNPESLGGALGSMAASAVAGKIQATGVVSGDLHAEASISRAQTVSITQPSHGAIQNYELTDTVACDLFGIQDINLANISAVAVDMVLSEKGSIESTLSEKLDKITAGHPEQKAAVLALLAKAEVGQQIAISRKLPTDTLFELNNLLNTIDETGQPKSSEALKADKAAADKIIQDPKSYVVSSFSLLAVAKEANNSRTNTIKGVDIMETGIIDVTQTATGSHVSLETVRIGGE